MATVKAFTELLRTTQQQVEHAMQTAQSVADQYLHGHEDVVSGTGWGGRASMASLTTAGQIHQDLGQTITGGHRLANGLGKTAVLFEHNEDDAAHGLLNVFNGGTAT